jgi:eight-cysteine-cluster-containing protein
MIHTTSRPLAISLGLAAAAVLLVFAAGAKKGCFSVKPIAPMCVDAAQDCADMAPPSDCKGGWVCDADAACAWKCKEDPGPTCSTDLDCGKNETCSCVYDCLTKPAPPCEPTCTCKPVEPVEPVYCSSDVDCAKGEACVCSGNCGGPLPIPCFQECTCQPLQPLGECMSDNDCGKGQICTAADDCLACASCPACAVCCGYCKDAEPEPSACYVGGCSGQLCSPNPDAISTCEFWPWYQCFQFSNCGQFGPNGQCGWENTKEYLACLEEFGGPDPKPEPQCYVGGCSGQLCTPFPDMASTCEWQEWYACFQYSSCGGFGEGGLCGWEKTAEFETCMKEFGGP